MLKTISLALVFSLAFVLPCVAADPGAQAQTEAPPQYGFAIIKTARVAVRQAVLVPGASWGREIDSNFSAFLIKHGEDTFLFDTGLGRQVDAQYGKDMPLFWRLFFSYDKPVRPARDQLEQAGQALPKRIILSHSHWDHASALQDFPEARIAIAAPEMALVQAPSRGPGGSWPSQLANPALRWELLHLQNIPYRGFARSLDLFGDGRAVLVDLAGHTPGSLGLFLTVDSGALYFLIGDAAWTVDALRAAAPKFWAAGALVDGDAAQTQRVLGQLQQLMQETPQLRLLPAHDSRAQDALGYFPQWLR
ncbi:glyoxylase-like metal-dependent hydrolase (beta-lactamase superfamily II) [Paucibacter oligotrophus]|uniref:Glyoxylase-like metal-dependent hydrolase (Beta-lactamase superfamily II) n=1 Tax=Roseateles oligotrophus TaxID=1769250 RepID=A0A840LAQ5_9BURK|nr:MBL fold metallo-hydrolase [Roseateles oligotrophus]MBB4843278.1 glyoxylase-like metal-dependent hydrolase (beta-lactamase superfamily II) [Roseateles oligotrophus]